jgi:endonuclease/exonuclease/phosphatase (EEP) superfamily protein YafD
MLPNEVALSEASDESADQKQAGWPSRLRSFLALLGCLFLISTALLPLLPVDLWWVRIWDFPRVQLLFTYILSIVVMLIFWRTTVARIFIGLLTCCVAIQFYWILPYLPLAPLEVKQANLEKNSTTLRILTANVLQDNENSALIIKLIKEKRPDVLVLCEVNDRWVADLKPVEKSFKHHLLEPLDNTYGIALYTNLMLDSAEVRHLVRDEVPSIDAKLRMSNGHPFQLLAVHPNPPRPGEDTTNRDAELVLAGREVKENNTAIVLGDMNDVAWSRTTNLFQEVSRLLDPRKGRGLFPTYNAKSWLIRYPLDYLFHSDDFCVVSIETLPYIGSDHFPLFVELSYEPSVEPEQEAPELDADDKEDAEHAVESATGEEE